MFGLVLVVVAVAMFGIASSAYSSYKVPSCQQTQDCLQRSGPGAQCGVGGKVCIDGTIFNCKCTASTVNQDQCICLSYYP